MAMVNPINPMLNPNAKDSRWLTLEVCREYQRNKCTRTENECKFAHPPAHVEVQNGRVIACFDSIKGKCQRKDPPCKYLHPPQHLREQLLQNGRNNLILKSLQYQALHQQVLPGIIPMAPHYLSTVPTTAVPQFNPYGIPAVAVQGGAADGTIVTPQVPSVITTPMPAKPQGRPDRLEVCREFQRGTCSRQPSDCRYAHPTENVTVDCGDNQVTVCMDYVKNKCTRDSCRYFHPPAHLQSQIKAAQQRANAAPSSSASGPAQGVPQLGLVPPYKRVAVESSNMAKSGIPVYQPTLPAAYHQAATLMQLQQQPYIPAVTYSGEVMSAAYPNYLQQDPVMVAGTQPPGVGAAPALMGTLTSPAAAASAGVAVASPVPSNAYSIQYFDRNKQLLDTLPRCPDFKVGKCTLPTCPKVHVLEDVETTEDGRVVVCRDSVRNTCKRTSCKYYHIPVPLPPST